MTTDELIKNALELCGTRYELEAGLKHRLLSELAHALARAEAERDAQHDLVLRLTAERDALSVVHACPPKGSGVMPRCGATPFEKQGERLTTNAALVTCGRQRLAADLDEARAQVWGLGCKVTNLRDALRRQYRENYELKCRLSDVESLRYEVYGLRNREQYRDCDQSKLTAENARLQQQVATLRFLHKGGH